MIKIYQVFDPVELKCCDRNPNILHFSVCGEVLTGGWSEPDLILSCDMLSPHDGFYDFDFVATPPCGSTTSEITPISVSCWWYDFPDDLHGVRIHSSSNSVEFRIKPLHRSASLPPENLRHGFKRRSRMKPVYDNSIESVWSSMSQRIH